MKPFLLLLLLLLLGCLHCGAGPASFPSPSQPDPPPPPPYQLLTAFTTDFKQLNQAAFAGQYSSQVAAALGVPAQVLVLSIRGPPSSPNRHLASLAATTVTSRVFAASAAAAPGLPQALARFQRDPEAGLGSAFMAAFGIAAGSVTAQVLALPTQSAAVDHEQELSAEVDSSKVAEMNIHGALLTVTYVLLLPLGALVARHKWLFGDRKLRSGLHVWFPVHLALQLCGFALCIAGFVVAWLYLPGDGSDLLHPDAWPGHSPAWCKSHQVLGTLVVAFTSLQVVVGFVRPSPGDTRLRPAWNLLHHNLGRLSILCSWPTIYIGIYMAHTSERYGNAGYVQWLVPVAGTMGLLIAADIYLTIMRTRQAAAVKEEGRVGCPMASNLFYGAQQPAEEDGEGLKSLARNARADRDSALALQVDPGLHPGAVDPSTLETGTSADVPLPLA